MKHNLVRRVKQMLITIVVSILGLYLVVCGLLYVYQERFIFSPKWFHQTSRTASEAHLKK